MFNQIIAGLSQKQKIEHYAALGQMALSNYDVDDCTSAFIQHNGGIITYRVNSEDEHPQFLLKLHIPAEVALL